MRTHRLTSGSLDTLSESLSNSFPDAEFLRTNVTEGSAIAKIITVEAGDRLTFDWNFLTFDYKPYVDFTFFSFPDDVDFDQSKIELASGDIINTRKVFFEPGEESQTITFPIHDDDIREGTESFNLYLLNTDADPLTGTQKATEIEIIDNEGAEITGSVWDDSNGNGIWDIGEFGLPDWTVYIDSNNNQQLDSEEISTLTNPNGFYSFEDLAEGTYTISEVIQEDWQQTYPGEGNSFAHTLSLDLGDKIDQINFGNFNDTLGEIHGHKWNDRDRDGIGDDGEETLPGWTIYLDDNNNGVLDPGEFATVTDAEGAYAFTSLQPGDYIVGEVMQPGWQQSYPNNEGNSVHAVSVNPGEHVTPIDFGNFYTAADPVAWWRLDEKSGTVAEDSIEDNDGDLQNGPTWITGRVNGGLSFDGIDDYVKVTDDNALDFGTDDFSISTWVKIYDGSGIILDKRIETSGPVQGYVLFHNNGRLGFQMADGAGGGGASYLSPVSIANGQWHQVTVTLERDSTSGGEVYIDGVKDGTFDPTGAQGSLSNSQDLLLGRRSDNPLPGSFQGALDEVKLFKTALTASEVLSLYENADENGAYDINLVNASGNQRNDPAQLAMDDSDSAIAKIRLAEVLEFGSLTVDPMSSVTYDQVGSDSLIGLESDFLAITGSRILGQERSNLQI